MRAEVLQLFARQFFVSVTKTKAFYFLAAIIVVLLVYSTQAGIGLYEQNHHRHEHQELARKSWEENPDKHPHRMAHFGTFAFRDKYTLSQFDFGIESYTGNAMFMEAHRQNTVNFSEAGFSSGTLRFGELSMAMILQTILPLIIIFLGFAAIVGERERSTLKLLLTQGAKPKEILIGKSLGLLGLALMFLMPFILVLFWLVVGDNHTTGDDWGRFGVISLIYIAYAFILCLCTVCISAGSRSSKGALVRLLGLWLLLTVVLPRGSQAVGSYLFPTPSKHELMSRIEAEEIEFGDSHNPDDPHYQHLKDSVLKVHQVQSVEELPFNYGGFVMMKGEEISTRIYNKHFDNLLDTYRQQNDLNHFLSLVNPYLAVKQISMSLSNTNFESYVHFQAQAEDYRYMLSQKMNELQIKYISPNKVSGSEGKSHVVSREEWINFPDFEHNHLTMSNTFSAESISFIGLWIWLILSVMLINISSKKMITI